MEYIERYPESCQQLAQGTEEEWDIRLFIEVAITNYLWLQPLRKQTVKLWQYEDGRNKLKKPEEILSFLQKNLAIIDLIGKRIAEYFTQDVQQLFGEEEADAKTIVSCAENVMGFYQELLDLKQSFKFVDTTRPYRKIVEEMCDVVESACETFDLYYHKLQVAKRKLEDLIEGKNEDGHLQIDLNLSLQINTEGLMSTVEQILS